MLALNIGCADVVFDRPGWVHIDIEPLWGVRGIMQMDVRQGLKFPTGAVDLIYASQFIEHLNLLEGIAFLRECDRVLVSGGVLRLVTPDLARLVRWYLDGSIASEEMNHKGQPCDVWGIKTPGNNFALWAYGALAKTERFTGHKHLYDLAGMTEALNRAGFRLVTERQPHDSASEELALIDFDRWATTSLYVEAVKEG